jgi:phosphoesterase RecJ-like protein
LKSNFYNLIEKNDKIIILRHKNPDGDAIGSQVGLYRTLKENYPEKQIYLTGDFAYLAFDIEMDTLSDEDFKDSLVIILDTSASKLVSDDRYSLAKDIIVIDHHKNIPDIPNISLAIIKNDLPSNCLIVADILLKKFKNIPTQAATYLYLGIVTDTGNFRFCKPSNVVETFKTTTKLLSLGADFMKINDLLTQESLTDRKQKDYFRNFEIYKDTVGYRIDDLESSQKFNLTPVTVSKKFVNLIAGINEIPIWITFTEDQDHKYLVEARSKSISIVDVCKKYGGGGHDNACGCILENKDIIYLVLEDLYRRSL